MGRIAYLIASLFGTIIVTEDLIVLITSNTEIKYKDINARGQQDTWTETPMY